MTEKPASRNQFRTVLKDGTLNVVAVRGLHLTDLYHDLLKISWRVFSFIFAAIYLVINLIFGLAYDLLPRSQFEGFHYTEGGMRYLESFFFSVQTFGTIGYGKISPIGIGANGIVTIECFFGIFMVAMATGLIFARFAKPAAKILFSEVAVIRKFDGVPNFMFRIANARQNYITDARVTVTLAIQDKKNGFRDFTELKLERHRSPIFALSWTIAHEIDSTSPLFGLSRDELFERDAEIVVAFSGSDTTLSQQVFSKYSYVVDDVLTDHDFANVIGRDEDGRVTLNIDKFHEVIPFAGT